MACGPRVSLRRAARRDCANQRSAPPLDTLPMKISAEFLSTGGGTQVLSTKPPYTSILFVPSSPHNSLLLSVNSLIEFILLKLEAISHFHLFEETDFLNSR